MSDDLTKQVAGRILSLKREEETWTSFAERVGLSPQVVSNWRKQGHGASLDAASTVLANVPRLSPAWLLAGVRPSYLPEHANGSEEAVRKEADVMAVRLRVIGKIANGELDPAAFERVASLSAERLAAVAAMGERAMEDARQPEASPPVQSPATKKAQ